MNAAPAEVKKEASTLRLSTPTPAARKPVAAAKESTERRSKAEPFLQQFTSPVAAAAILAASAVLIGWSLQTRATVGPQLRFPPPAAPPKVEDPRRPVLDAEQLNRIQKQADSSRQRLVQAREDFHHLLNTVEESARQNGWQLRFSMLPAVSPHQGFTELVSYPVSAQLDLAERRGTNTYPAVLRWVNEISHLPQAAEVTSLALRGDRRGLSSARVEIQFVGKNEDATSEEAADH